MATEEEMLQEANKRGLLTGEKKAMYDEAVRRGLIADSAPAGDAQQKGPPAVYGKLSTQQPGVTMLDAGASIASDIAGEIAGGVVGVASLPWGVDQAVENLNRTRDAISFGPFSDEGKAAKGAFGTAMEGVTDAVRLPVSGIAGLAALPAGLDTAADTVRKVQGEGVGRFLGDVGNDIAGPTGGAIGETLPAAVLTALGLKAGRGKTVKPPKEKLTGVNKEVRAILKREKINIHDTSPKNIERIKTAVADDIAAMEERARIFKEAGLVDDAGPLRAQVTRSADDFQAQQEAAKTSTAVRSRLEAQEGRLASTFDDAIDRTGGRAVTSSSTAVDEVVGRSVALDKAISGLYKEAEAAIKAETAARNLQAKAASKAVRDFNPVADGRSVVLESGRSKLISGIEKSTGVKISADVSKGARTVGAEVSKAIRDAGLVETKNLSAALRRHKGSNSLTNGMIEAINGELKYRGIVNKNGKVVRGVGVAEAEEIRKFMNSLHSSTTPAGREILHSLKSSLDGDVFRTAGKDVFLKARKAKTDFEQGLNKAKVSKFDKNKKNLVRDMLENKIDPDTFTESAVFRKGYRSSDLQQLKDYLQQTKAGAQAFDDLRAQTLQGIKDRAFTGPVDSAGNQAITRASLERALKSVGDARMKVLFSPQELKIIDTVVQVSKLREPVRGTAVGRGPSAQAIARLEKAARRSDTMNVIIEIVTGDMKGKAAMKTPGAPSVGTRTPVPVGKDVALIGGVEEATAGSR